MFTDLGHISTHARDLPDGHATKDETILQLPDYDVVIVSRDSDFYQSALIKGKPDKLVYVRIANMRRQDLIQLFRKSADQLIELLHTYDILQLEEEAIITIS